MRVVVVIPYEDDPSQTVMLAPKGLDCAQAQRLIETLVANYPWMEEDGGNGDYEPITYLHSMGFDHADWIDGPAI